MSRDPFRRRHETAESNKLHRELQALLNRIHQAGCLFAVNGDYAVPWVSIEVHSAKQAEEDRLNGLASDIGAC